MKIAIEIFVSLFILIIMVALCVGLVSSDLDVMEARDFYYSCVTELQQSNFADDVITACVENAQNQGYILDVQIFPSESGDRFVKLTLKYDYKVPAIGIKQEKIIEGTVS